MLSALAHAAFFEGERPAGQRPIFKRTELPFSSVKTTFHVLRPNSAILMERIDASGVEIVEALVRPWPS